MRDADNINTDVDLFLENIDTHVNVDDALQAIATPGLYISNLNRLIDTAYWLPKYQEPSGYALTELRGLGVGNAILGSTEGANTNAPKDHAAEWTANGDSMWFPGTSGNHISVTRPVASVDIVVTYSDGTNDSTLTAQTANPLILGGTSGVFANRYVKSIQLLNNSGGAEVGLYQANAAAQSGYTDIYSNAFSHFRSATGAKLHLVSQPALQLASTGPHYLEVADHPLLDFGAGQDFAVGVLIRQHGSPQTFSRLIEKGEDGVNGAWSLANNSTNRNVYLSTTDSTGNSDVSDVALSSGGDYEDGIVSLLSGVRSGVSLSRAVDSVIDGFVTRDNNQNLANDGPVRIGSRAYDTNNSGDYEFLGAYVCRRVLTSNELAAIRANMLAALGGRVSQPLGGGSDPAYPANAFVTTWQTTGAAETITVPTHSGGTYNCTVYWGDGSSDEITTYDDTAWTHEYATAGIYTVQIVGTFSRIYFNNTGDRLKIKSVEQLGQVNWGSDQSNAFNGCSNMVWNGGPESAWSGVTNFSSTWHGCSSLTSFPLLDVSSCTNFVGTWRDCSSLTSFPLLDVSSGTNFNSAWQSTNMGTASWDAILIDLDTNNPNTGVSLHGGSATYSAGAAATARANLIARTPGWTITDGGLAS